MDELLRVPDADPEVGPHAAREIETPLSDLVCNLEEAAGPGDFVLCGEPSSGRTQTILEAIAARPIIAREAPASAANVFLAHYSAVSETADRARSIGVENVVCIRTPAHFGSIGEAVEVGAPVLLVCLDTLFARLCQSLAGVSVQRIVFDNLESLRVKSYPIVRCEAKWFLCTPRLIGSPAPMNKSRARRDARLAAREGRMVETASARCYREPKQILYRETATQSLVSTIDVLYRNGRTGLATACLPCENLRRADAGLVLDERAVSRLGDPCPVCFEPGEPGPLPRLLVPCCKNSFCAKCIVRHLAHSRACPMCRADVDIHACTSVSETLAPRVGGIVRETRSLLKKCLRAPGAKVLVVSGEGVDDSISDLMWHAEVDFVDIRGNSRTIERRLREFSTVAPGGEDGAESRARLAVVRNHQLGFAPIRTPALTHVIFIGHLTRHEQIHWETRGRGPSGACDVPTPNTFTVQSVYDKTFEVFA